MHDPGSTHHQAPMDLSHHVALEGQGHHGRSKIGLLRFDFAAWGRKKNGRALSVFQKRDHLISVFCFSNFDRRHVWKLLRPLTQAPSVDSYGKGYGLGKLFKVCHNPQSEEAKSAEQQSDLAYEDYFIKLMKSYMPSSLVTCKGTPYTWNVDRPLTQRKRNGCE